MRIILVLAMLLLAISAKAGPATGLDEVPPPFSERNFLSRIGDVGDKVEAKASELVTNAMTFLGVPYKRGGSSVATGFDCSGFVRAIYEQTAGLVLPRSAVQQAAAAEKIDRNDLQPGDLVFFNSMRRTFSHVGIYIGNGEFIHSPKPGAKVRVESLSLAYWARRFDGARRVSVDSQSESDKP